MTADPSNRRWIARAFAPFFLVGATIAWICAIAPGLLNALWQLDPRIHEEFALMGSAAMLLMFAVFALCLAAAWGLGRAKPWAYVLALALLIVDLVCDIANVVVGNEPRAAVGVPIVVLLLVLFSTRRVRAYFNDRLA